MAETRSFADLIIATGQQKFAAAQARQNPDATAEKPRDAIFDALRMVGEAIGPQGFSFKKSGPSFSRKSGDLTFEIVIQSDRNNVAGRRAAIWVHVAIHSKSVASWRKAHASIWIRPSSPLPMPMYGNQLGYLCDPSGWVEWNFADNTTRGSVANDLIASIQKGAFPLFSKFEGSPEDIAAISNQDWPPPEGILTYLLATGHAQLANETLRTYFDTRPELRRNFERFHHKFSAEGLPSYRTGIPHDLAAFAVATGLTLDES